MTTPATPASPNPAGDDRNLVAVNESTAVTFEEKLNLFWKKYRTAILALCAIGVAAILGKGAWEYLQGQKEAEIGSAYAAATTTEQLKSFSAAHPDHPLSGIAQLRMADEAYTAGKSADAIAGYEKAAAVLKNSPLGARAQMGRALAKVQAGKAAEATNELKQLVNDQNQLKAIRTEAGYHLMSLAVEAGDNTEAQKYSDQVMQIDPGSDWTRRALQLRATLPPAAAPSGSAAPAPGADQPKQEGSQKIEVKVPGK